MVLSTLLGSRVASVAGAEALCSSAAHDKRVRLHLAAGVEFDVPSFRVQPCRGYVILSAVCSALRHSCYVSLLVGPSFSSIGHRARYPSCCVGKYFWLSCSAGEYFWVTLEDKAAGVMLCSTREHDDSYSRFFAMDCKKCSTIGWLPAAVLREVPSVVSG